MYGVSPSTLDPFEKSTSKSYVIAVSETSISKVPLTVAPSMVTKAVIVTLPSDLPVTTPFASTVAIFSSELSKRTLAPFSTSTAVPFA